MSRRVVWIGLLASLVLVGGAGWWLGAASQSPDQAAARAEEPSASWVTATVDERVLSATVIQRGDVAPEQSVSAGVPSSVEGEGVVTQVLVSVGDSPVEGDRLVEVSGRPVFVLEGDVPVYRSLRPTMSGADVRQLQDALTRLGFTPETDGVFGAKTKQAVNALYEAAGYEPIASSATSAVDIAAAEQAVTDAESQLSAAQTAVEEVSVSESSPEVAQAQVALSQARRAAEDARASRASDVAFAEGDYNAAVRERDRANANPEATATERDQAQVGVDQAWASLEQIRASTQSAVESADEQVLLAEIALEDLLDGGNVDALNRDVALAEEAVVQAEALFEAARAAAGPTVPQGEVVFVPSFPVRVLTAQSAVGSIGGGDQVAPEGPPGDTGGGGGGGEVVELAAGELVVTTNVRPNDVGLLRNGLAVELLDETTSTVYAATITQLATDPVAGPDGQLGYPAVLVPDEALPDSLTGANLRVTATTASTESAALVVPVAAVSSSAAGEARVTVVDGPNDETPVDVKVSAGLSADGFVAVEPVDAGSLAAGELVVVGK